MADPIDALMVFVVLTQLMIVSSSRLGACIRKIAAQGTAVGILPVLLAYPHGLSARIAVLAAVSVGVRGILFPWLLVRSLREAGVRREVEPFVGYTWSITVALLCLFTGFYLSGHVPAAPAHPSSLVIPVGLASILIGLFLIVSRKLALNQVLGYLVMENGISIFGLALVVEIPMLVELGVLLDAFVAIFVMSIATYRISREFDHIDVNRLDSLKG